MNVADLDEPGRGRRWSSARGDHGRDPQSENLRLRMEARDHLAPDEQALVIGMIEGGLLRHHARQLNVG